jgi:hypothetical protein
MRAGYKDIRKNLPLVAKQCLMVSGLLLLPLTSRLEKISGKPVPAAPHVASLPVAPSRPDPRTVRLRRFLSSLRCPVSFMAEDFVHAADDNHLDWRLLPSISVIESGGGKAYRNNNIFGWNNGLQPFPTIRAGLNLVAFKLGKSSLYRQRDVIGKLRLYNPDETYPQKVVDVMNRISPAPQLVSAVRELKQDQLAFAN